MSTKTPILFTPGPLMTSETVKQAMLKDYGSRDKVFMDAVQFVRDKMLEIANVQAPEWVCIPQPGAGTMGIEAAIQTLTPQKACYVLINSGKYAQRQAAIARRKGIRLVELEVAEGEDIDMDALEALLKSLPHVSALGYVHHETSTGMKYPGRKIYRMTKSLHPNATVIADCMSSFGGMAFHAPTSCDCLITSPNKCLHSLPGLSLIIVRRRLVQRAKGWARSDTLDLRLQLESFDRSGQFRITPPTSVVMALQQAIKEFQRDGGIEGREKQYEAKFRIVVESVLNMGFTLFLRHVRRPGVAHIVVCVNMPTDPRWNFKRFYQYLNQRGYVIYPGKASKANTFRFGLIGHTSLEDVKALMKVSEEALQSMGIARLIPGAKL